mmetsp:Transcript_106902/g.312546  ORF Transcript_106902/g.312546 Transcript_106902/m.312546 type:complete len:776 (-) Transcript_106902:47-2374(-)
MVAFSEGRLRVLSLLVVRLQLLLANVALPAVPADAASEEAAAAQGRGALVTGAAGFIGSHVARHCLDLGMKVIALDDLSGGFEANVPKGAVFIKGDVKDAMLLERIFTEHTIDYVYHLGAYAAEGLSHFIRSFNYRTNLVGSVEILNQAVKHHVSCFVFTSSIAVYGSINDLSQMQNANRSLSTSGHKPKSKVESKGLSETDRPTPEDPYGIAKYAFELDLHAAKELFGLDFIIFRPHNVYGPHQNMFDKYRNVVGIFINQIAHGKPLTIFGDGEQVRAFSYIDDVAPVISRGPLVAKARNEIFNVGADKPYTVNELARAITHSLEKEGYPIDYQPARLEVEVAVSTHDKVKEYFATPAAILLEEGLKKTVVWYKSQGKFFKPVEFTSVEVVDRMPPSWVRSDLRETSICQGSRVETEAMKQNQGMGSVVHRQEEDYLLDEDLAFWVAASQETNLMPGALHSIRQFYKRSPILILVDGGGSTAEFKELCKMYSCTVQESDCRMGTPHSSGGIRPKDLHNFTCGGYLSRISSILPFAPSAMFVVIYEPENRMLSRLRIPEGKHDVYQLGNMGLGFPVEVLQDLNAVEGFPHVSATAGGTIVRRSSILTMLNSLPALEALILKHGEAAHASQNTCLFMLAGLGRLRLTSSPDVMQSSDSCEDSNSLLFPCYRCIHSCKMHENCYQKFSWSERLPRFLRSPVNKIAFAIAGTIGGMCFVQSEECVCSSSLAARRASACIRGCSYTCPALLHSRKGRTKSQGAFVDCVAEDDVRPRTEL